MMTMLRLAGAALMLVAVAAGYRGVSHDVGSQILEAKKVRRTSGAAQNAPSSSQLWATIQEGKSSLLANQKLKYVDGVPLTAPPENASSLDASIANILFYLDAQHGILTPRHPKEEEFAREVSSLESQLREKNVVAGPDAIADALYKMDRENRQRYFELLTNVPNSSKAGYLAYLVKKSIVARGDDLTSGVIEGLKKLASSYGYTAVVRAVDPPRFDSVKACLDNGCLLVAVGKTPEESATIVGYFINQSKPYLIAHDPRKGVAANISESSTGLAKVPPMRLDVVGSIDQPTLPAGVTFISPDSWPYRGFVAVGKPQRDIYTVIKLLKTPSTNERR